MAQRKKAYTQMPYHVHGEIKSWSLRHAISPSGLVDQAGAEELAKKAERWVTAATELSSRVASVLGRASIPVNWVTTSDPNKAGAIAYTDGDGIFLNLSWFLHHVVAKALSLESDDRDDAKLAWVVFKGIVFHELSHILFTPRQTQKPMPQLKKLAEESDRFGYEALLYKAMNILEDSRIESLFTLRYAPAKPVLTAVVREAILDDSNADSPMAALLLHGRKYLPLDVRVAADQAFIDRSAVKGWEQLAHKILAMIDEYLLLTFPADADRAIEIIVAIADFLGGEGRDADRQLRSFDDHTSMKSGKPASPAEQREAAAEMAATLARTLPMRPTPLTRMSRLAPAMAVATAPTVASATSRTSVTRSTSMPSGTASTLSSASLPRPQLTPIPSAVFRPWPRTRGRGLTAPLALGLGLLVRASRQRLARCSSRLRKAGFVVIRMGASTSLM